MRGVTRTSSVGFFFRSFGNATIWLWRPVVVRFDGSIDGVRLWREYGKRLRNWPRVGRMVFWWCVAVLLLRLQLSPCGSHGSWRFLPAALGDRNLFSLHPGSSATSLLIVLFVLVGGRHDPDLARHQAR